MFTLMLFVASLMIIALWYNVPNRLVYSVHRLREVLEFVPKDCREEVLREWALDPKAFEARRMEMLLYKQRMMLRWKKQVQ